MQLKKIFKLNVFLAFSLCLAGLLFCGLFFWFPNPVMPVSGSSDQFVTARKDGGRVLVILIDSLPSECMFDPEIMPFLASCRSRGAWGISRLLSVPISVNGDKAIFASGIDNSFASLIEDFKGGPFTGPNIFRKITDAGGICAVLSNTCLSECFGKYAAKKNIPDDSLRFNQYNKNAEFTFKTSYEFLKNEKWTFAAVQFISLDYVGHLETPCSRNYRKLAGTIDDYIRNIVALTLPSDTVLITSEHGMDANGFHMEDSPDVIKTGFLFWGPMVRKTAAEHEVFQIDWAPTLSVVAGVSYFYDYPSLPLLGLLDLDDRQRKALIENISTHYGLPGNSDWQRLEMRRTEFLGVKRAPLAACFILASAFLSIAFILYVFLKLDMSGLSLRGKLISVFCSTLLILFLPFTLSPLNEYIIRVFPFRADIIFSHPFKFISFLLFIVLVSCFFAWLIKKYFPAWKNLVILCVFMCAVSSFFSSTGAYHLISWAAISFFAAAFVFSRRIGWLFLLVFFIAGLLSRRFGDMNSMMTIDLPLKYIAAFAVYFSSVVILFFLNKGKPWPGYFLNNITLIFPLFICLLPLPIMFKIVPMLLVFLAYFFLFRENSPAHTLIFSYWISFYYLVSSSSSNHLALWPAFLIIFTGVYLVRFNSCALRGILCSLIIWCLYMIPGHSYSLKFTELFDKYIMDMSSESQIGIVVFIIASRYIFPLAMILYLMRQFTGNLQILLSSSLSLVPAIAVTGSLFFAIIYEGYDFFPWADLQHLAFFGIYFILVVSGIFTYGFFRVLRRLIDRFYQRFGK